MKLANRIYNISPSMTLVVADKARKMTSNGIDVISFATGEPDFPTPELVKEEAIKWIKKDFTKYVASNGITELKMAICRKLEIENGLKYDQSQILIGNGAKQMIYEACGTLLNPGDEVIIPTPCWVSYVEQVKLFGGVPVLVETSEENNFRITADIIQKAITPKTKAIILNSPNNPTGAVIPVEELEKIAELAVTHNIFVISDEVYEKLVYVDYPCISIGSLNDSIKELTLTVNSLSKSYCMTGWRIGYVAASKEVIDGMASIHGHNTGNVNSITQKAAVEALNSFHDFATMKNEYLKRCDYIVGRLNNIPDVSCNTPDGAFYVFVNIKGLMGKKYNGKEINSSLDLAEFLIEQAHVACVPGSAFGLEGYIRLTFAIAQERIEKGMDRIEASLQMLR